MERSMHKHIFQSITLFLILLALSACNLPSNNTPTPDLVATEVSKILTSTLNIPILTPPILINTATLPSEENTVTPQVEQTTTPTLTNTPEITPLPTLAGLPTGAPNWSDSLDNGTRFGLNNAYDDGHTRFTMDSGALLITSVNAEGWRGWRLTSQKPQNYYMKAIYKTQSCSGSDQYGILVQAPNYETGSGYYFGLTCDGRFAIQRWKDDGLTNLNGWNNSTEIHSGNDQENTIGILKSGNKYKYYLNGVVVAEVEDNAFSNPGYFGPFIVGLETKNFTVGLEEISYWNLP